MADWAGSASWPQQGRKWATSFYSDRHVAQTRWQALPPREFSSQSSIRSAIPFFGETSPGQKLPKHGANYHLELWLSVRRKKAPSGSVMAFARTTCMRALSTARNSTRSRLMGRPGSSANLKQRPSTNSSSRKSSGTSSRSEVSANRHLTRKSYSTSATVAPVMDSHAGHPPNKRSPAYPNRRSIQAC